MANPIDRLRKPRGNDNKPALPENEFRPDAADQVEPADDEADDGPQTVPLPCDAPAMPLPGRDGVEEPADGE